MSAYSINQDIRSLNNENLILVVLSLVSKVFDMAQQVTVLTSLPNSVNLQLL